jgi:hypothetical protein
MAGSRRGRHMRMVVCGVVFLAVTGGPTASASVGGRSVPSRSRSFVSLWQPRGASSPVVEQFSLRAGALLSTLARYDSSKGAGLVASTRFTRRSMDHSDDRARVQLPHWY